MHTSYTLCTFDCEQNDYGSKFVQCQMAVVVPWSVGIVVKMAEQEI
jgi:hypothetical protein